MNHDSIALSTLSESVNLCVFSSQHNAPSYPDPVIGPCAKLLFKTEDKNILNRLSYQTREAECNAAFKEPSMHTIAILFEPPARFSSHLGAIAVARLEHI